jgi:hypothetical protein
MTRALSATQKKSAKSQKFQSTREKFSDFHIILTILYIALYYPIDIRRYFREKQINFIEDVRKAQSGNRKMRCHRAGKLV